jgi:DNA-binding Xre family transcriptional regulator
VEVFCSVPILINWRGMSSKIILINQLGGGPIMLVSHVKRMMEERGVSITKLMELTGLANETIQRARRGGGPGQLGSCTLLTLETIAKALKVKIRDLFEED